MFTRQLTLFAYCSRQPHLILFTRREGQEPLSEAKGTKITSLSLRWIVDAFNIKLVTELVKQLWEMPFFCPPKIRFRNVVDDPLRFSRPWPKLTRAKNDDYRAIRTGCRFAMW